MKGWFKNWVAFHEAFHKTELIKIEGRYYVHCKTCERYVPPMPVGRCPKCKKKMICGLKKYRCWDCRRTK